MILDSNETKKFIKNIIKLVNQINRYNVESVLLIQFCVTEKNIVPIIINKPKDIDPFEYLSEVYIGDSNYSRIVKYIDRDKIKKKRDATQYSPILIGSLDTVSILDIEEKDLFDTKYILPFKYNKYNKFTNIYFLITDLFKFFISTREKEIDKIEVNEYEVKFYDKEKSVFDISNFLLKVKLNESVTHFIKSNSPESVFPIKINCNNDFFSEDIKNILINLNTSIINNEAKDVLVFNKDILHLTDEDIEFKELLENLKNNGTFYAENKDKTIKILTFDEFFKGNPKELYFMKKESKSLLSDGTTVPIVNVGLVLKYKENLIYIFYKYFKYDEE